MGNSRGGARAGAGRKPKAIKYETQIQAAERRIADRLPWLVEKLFELANGVLVEDVNPVTGTVSVYQKVPDRDALKYLVDRVMGKPTDHTDVNVSNDNWIFDPTETLNASSSNGAAE